MAVVSQPNPSNPSAAFPSYPSAAIAVTKSDSDTYAFPITVYVGGAGDVAIVPANGGSAVTFVGLPAGSVVPCLATKVMSTDTTATNLVGVY